ncbi:MAG: DEAD/DEAH box helicase [Bacilli bacterium]
MKFKELNLNPKIIKAVEEMGFIEMMPIQEKAIPFILEGKDVVGQAQTGTGKTAAFGVPMFENIEKGYINHLVMAPTRELAIQIVDELRRIGKYYEDVNIATIVGGMDMKRQINSLKQNPPIIVATPGRLNDFLSRKKLSLAKIKMFVVDEVDEMFKAGFKEEIDEIIKYLPEKKQSLLFSATISQNVENIARETMDDRVTINVSSKQEPITNIMQECIVLKEKNKFPTLTKLLDIDKPNLAIVFGRTKRRADELGEALNKAGYKALSLHGDLSQSQRNVVMKKFRGNDGHILVATDVAARGIDVTGVTHVYNFDLPEQTEYYTHRIGRTGRAGSLGKAITFARDSELSHIEQIKKDTNSTINIVSAPTMDNIREVNKERITELFKDVLKRLDVSKNKELAKKLIDEFSAEKLVMAAIEMNMRKENISDIQLTGEPPVKNKRVKSGYSRSNKRNNRSYEKRGKKNNRNRKQKSSNRKNNNYSKDKKR